MEGSLPPLNDLYPAPRDSDSDSDPDLFSDIYRLLTISELLNSSPSDRDGGVNLDLDADEVESPVTPSTPPTPSSLPSPSTPPSPVSPLGDLLAPGGLGEFEDWWDLDDPAPPVDAEPENQTVVIVGDEGREGEGEGRGRISVLRRLVQQLRRERERLTPPFEEASILALACFGSFTLHRSLRVTSTHPQLCDTLQSHPLFPGCIYFASGERIRMFDSVTRVVEDVAAVSPRGDDARGRLRQLARGEVAYFKVAPSGRFLVFGEAYSSVVNVLERKMGGGGDGGHWEGATRRRGRGMCRDYNYACFDRSETRLLLVGQSSSFVRYWMPTDGVREDDEDEGEHDNDRDEDVPRLRRVPGVHSLGSYPNCVALSNGVRHEWSYSATCTDGDGYQLFSEDGNVAHYLAHEGVSYQSDYCEFNCDGSLFATVGSGKVRVYEVCDVKSLPFTQVCSFLTMRGVCKFHPSLPNLLGYVGVREPEARNAPRTNTFVLVDVSTNVEFCRLPFGVRILAFTFEAAFGRSLFVALRNGTVLQLNLALSMFGATRFHEKLYELQRHMLLTDVIVETCE